MNDICLFIGGPCDGQRIKVPQVPFYERHNVAIRPGTVATYYVGHIRTVGTTIRFCHHENLSSDAAVQEVFNRYPLPPTPNPS